MTLNSEESGHDFAEGPQARPASAGSRFRDVHPEVVQDSVVDLICAERIRFASTCALTLSAPALNSVYGDLKTFRHRTLMRPQEISNHPEVIRRLELISINTA